MLTNIGRDKTDPAFRYRMPQMVVRYEGRGNGRTVIENIDQIAKALHRPAIYLLKFIAGELGTSVKVQPQSGRALIRGRQDPEFMAEILEVFIAKFVLCPGPTCGLPETELYVNTATGSLRSDCHACGHSSKIVNKFCTFIVKHPDIVSKYVHFIDPREAADPDVEAPPMQEPVDDEEVIWYSETTAEATAKRQAALLGLSDSSPSTSEEEHESNESPVPTLADTLVLTPEDPLQYARDTLVACMESDPKPESVAAVVEAITSSAGALIRSEIPHVVHGVLLPNKESAAKRVVLYESALKAVCQTRAEQLSLLGWIETLFVAPAVTETDAPPVSYAPIQGILQALYQTDLVSDEVLFHWRGQKGSSTIDRHLARKIRSAAKQFFEWLEQAETESE